jgi:hypothetical protein
MGYESAHNSIPHLKKQLHAVTRERDEAKAALHKAHADIKEMDRAFADAARLRTSHDHMRQDLDALKVSLESSERIRKQQKALIAFIQKSNSVLDGNVSAIDLQSVDSRSLDSRSVSIDSRSAEGGGPLAGVRGAPQAHNLPTPPISARRRSAKSLNRSGSASLTPSVVVANENRTWLNSSYQGAHHSSDTVSMLSIDMGEGSMRRSRDSRDRRGVAAVSNNPTRKSRGGGAVGVEVLTSLMDTINRPGRSPSGIRRRVDYSASKKAPIPNNIVNSRTKGKKVTAPASGRPPLPPRPPAMGYKGVSAKMTSASRARAAAVSTSFSSTNTPSSKKKKAPPSSFGVGH